jgi:hypothetical protein
MNPSTQVKNRVIVFHDKTAKYITDKEEAFLFSPAVTARGLGRIGSGNDYEVVNLKNIAKIISSEEYRRLYPEKASTEYRNFSAEKPFKWESQHEKGISEIVKGLEQYIASDKYQGSRATIELRDKMKRRLADGMVLTAWYAV